MARLHCGTQLICMMCSIKLLISSKMLVRPSPCLPLPQEEAENTKFALEQKIQDLESRSYVSTPSSGQVRQTAAQQQLLLQQEEQRQLAQQELQKQLAEQQQQAADAQKKNEELLASRCVPYKNNACYMHDQCMGTVGAFVTTIYLLDVIYCSCTYAVKLCFRQV